jgi:hypothetical protein
MKAWLSHGRSGALALIALVLAANSPRSSAWSIRYSPSMPSQMVAAEDGSYYFDFPGTDGVHYVTKTPLREPRQSITMRFAIIGNGTFVATQGDQSARVRLFMQRRNDNMTAREEHKRFWSVAYVELVPGEFTLSSLLDENEWFSVFGRKGSEARGEFRTTLSNLGSVGFTFGGMFAGHGVYLTGGNARFVLKEFDIR